MPCFFKDNIFLVINMADLKAIGKNVQKLRKQMWYTQEQLAEKINISTVHMSHIETGAVTMSLDCLLNLCQALNTTPDSILLGSYSIDSSSTVKQLLPYIERMTDDEKKFLLDFAEALDKSKINRG